MGRRWRPRPEDNPLHQILGYNDSEDEDSELEDGAEDRVTGFLAELSTHGLVEGGGARRAAARWLRCVDPRSGLSYLWDPDTDAVKWAAEPASGEEAGDGAGVTASEAASKAAINEAAGSTQRAATVSAAEANEWARCCRRTRGPLAAELGQPAVMRLPQQSGAACVYASEGESTGLRDGAAKGQTNR